MEYDQLLQGVSTTVDTTENKGEKNSGSFDINGMAPPDHTSTIDQVIARPSSYPIAPVKL